MENSGQAINIGKDLKREQVPNNMAVLILGILSIIPGVVFFGLLGIILGIITLSIAAGAMELINQNPGKYTKSSIQLVKAGRICGIIGLILSSLFMIILFIFALSFSSSLMGNTDYYF